MPKQHRSPHEPAGWAAAPDPDPPLAANESLHAWIDRVLGDPAATDDLKRQPIPANVSIMVHPSIGWSAVIKYADGRGRVGQGAVIGSISPEGSYHDGYMAGTADAIDAITFVRTEGPR